MSGGLRAEVARSEESLRACYRLRYEVMCRELGWVSEDSCPGGLEMDEYDVFQAVSFLAYDGEQQVVGTVRLILSGELPLPVQRHFALQPWQQIEAAHGRIGGYGEVSRFVVPPHPRFKRHEITLGLCGAVIAEAEGLQLTHLFMSADKRFYRLLRMLGFPIAQVGRSRFYMGSETIPAVFPIGRLKEKALLYEKLTGRKAVEAAA
jgi:N-acyl-L-homoserine lactone synthetase